MYSVPNDNCTRVGSAGTQSRRQFRHPSSPRYRCLCAKFKRRPPRAPSQPRPSRTLPGEWQPNSSSVWSALAALSCSLASAREHCPVRTLACMGPQWHQTRLSHPCRHTVLGPATVGIPSGAHFVKVARFPMHADCGIADSHPLCSWLRRAPSHYISYAIKGDTLPVQESNSPSPSCSPWLPLL